MNVIENFNFATIYLEVILSTYSEVHSFLSTIFELLGASCIIQISSLRKFNVSTRHQELTEQRK